MLCKVHYITNHGDVQEFFNAVYLTLIHSDRANGGRPFSLARRDIRVLYRVDEQRHQVTVLAIGIKMGNRLLIGGVEVQL
jgi:hypothetical protein